MKFIVDRDEILATCKVVDVGKQHLLVVATDITIPTSNARESRRIDWFGTSPRS